MSLQTSALEYAINYFDTIWTQFIKEAKESKDFYNAATLTWKDNTFNLTTNEDNEIVYEYNNRTNVILFTLSYQYNILDTNKDEDTIKLETLNSLKDQLKTLQQAEQEIDIKDKDIKTPACFDCYNMNLDESSYAITHFNDLSLVTRETIIEFLNVMQGIKDSPDDIIQNRTQNTETFETDLGDIFSRWLTIAVNFVSRRLLVIDNKENILQLTDNLHTVIANQGPLKETFYGRFLQLSLYDIEMENFNKYADAIYDDIVHKKVSN